MVRPLRRNTLFPVLPDNDSKVTVRQSATAAKIKPRLLIITISLPHCMATVRVKRFYDILKVVQ